MNKLSHRDTIMALEGSNPFTRVAKRAFGIAGRAAMGVSKSVLSQDLNDAISNTRNAISNVYYGSNKGKVLTNRDNRARQKKNKKENNARKTETLKQLKPIQAHVRRYMSSKRYTPKQIKIKRLQQADTFVITDKTGKPQIFIFIFITKVDKKPGFISWTVRDKRPVTQLAQFEKTKLAANPRLQDIQTTL